uniref:Methylglutaconyl-CoA hydratase n=1 Tax=Kwoniella bestiolae CBS 10118 TaxID=1296100 RepID=A0A1B9G2T5_9TREE|nr:methylglutaconyl-CoA hydratase [Kwoniella bestiolae CBS 10118]OCF25337.1 methylglutaconyl-CoA hydratase [Kwoniella bestiolae CBS 10118]
MVSFKMIIPSSLRTRLFSSRLGVRTLITSTSTDSPPHAYLRPYLQTKSDAQPENEGLEGVMSLVLDRPETKNALSVRMVAEMREGIAKLDSMPFTSSRILLLQSSQPNLFCSGADLRERRNMSQEQVSGFLDSLRDMLRELEGIKVPSIAVIDGYALGGGAELALGCDLRVGGENTKIALPETKLGIIPGAGGTQRLTHLVGVSKAKELIYTGKQINGVEAERLINTYSPQPFQSALTLSKQIMTSAPLALSSAKTAISSASRLPLEDGLDLERKVYNALLDTEDRQEGLRAFKEKRKAVFKGR